MGLYLKLHQIMCETEGIEKKLNVGFGSNSYKAISEASVLNEVKPLLKKYGVILFPVEVKATEHIDSFTTAKGESSRLMTQVIVKYKIVDIHTGEFEIIETIGNGVDTQDKASGKAMTYALKVLLQKTFMLFSGEDTDNTHSDEYTSKNEISKKATPPKDKQEWKQNIDFSKKITDSQVKRLYALATGKNAEAKAIISEYGFASAKDITLDKYEDICKKMEELKNE